MNHIPPPPPKKRKKEKRQACCCYVKSPAVQDVFRLISCSGETGRWGQLSHAQNAVRQLASSTQQVQTPWTQHVFVRHPLKILASERSWLSRIVNAHMVCVSACRSTGGTGSTSMLLNDFCFLFLPLLSCLGTIVLQTHNRGDHKSSSVYLDSIETIHAVDQELKSPSY